MKSVLRWLGDWAPYMAIAAPVLLCVFYVYTFGINVIWADQYNGMLPLFEKWYDGTLRFADFWAQHNEHRHVVPRLLMFALGLWTEWNVWAELAVIQLTVIANLWMTLAVFRRQCVTTGQLWLMLPLAFLATSLRQSENFVFGWQLVFMLTVATALGAFYYLHVMNEPRLLKLKFAAAIAAATTATYSAASGLLVWPAGVLPLLLLPHGRRKKLAWAGIWLAIGAAEWGAYFCGYVKPVNCPPLGFSWQYFAATVGGALFATENPAMEVGNVILIITAISVLLAIKERTRGRYSFWLAMIAFGLLTQAANAAGRSLIGPEYALNSRYTTFSLLVVIGVYGILSTLGIENMSRLRSALRQSEQVAGRAMREFALISALWGSLLGLVAVGLVLTITDARREGMASREYMQYAAFVLCTSQSQPDEAIGATPDMQAAEVRHGLEFLKQHGWNLFASDALTSRYAIPDASLPTLPASASVELMHCAFSKESGVLVVTGWALDDAAKELVGGVYLEVDGVTYPAYYGLSRSEVAETLKNENVTCCGFARNFSRRQLGTGRHQLVIKVVTKDRSGIYTPTTSFGFAISP